MGLEWGLGLGLGRAAKGRNRETQRDRLGIPSPRQGQQCMCQIRVFKLSSDACDAQVAQYSQAVADAAAHLGGVRAGQQR